MQEDLKTGDVDALLAALNGAAKLSVDRVKDWVIVSTDTSEIDALRAQMDVERNALLYPNERDSVLVRFQQREYSLGAWHYMLGSNIYGWSVGESLKSNMGGGRWAQTSRGLTLAQAIAWGCEQAKHKNVRFSFSFSRLPADVRAAVEALLASKA